MPKRKIKKNNEKTAFTRLVWWIAIIAIAIEFILSMMYINSDIAFDRQFGYITLMEALFAMSFLAIDPIRYGLEYAGKPKEFRKFQLFNENGNGNGNGKSSLKFLKNFAFIFIFAFIVIAQVIVQFVPLTVRRLDRALAIIFAAPAEEMIFRGVLLSIFIRLGKNSPTKIKITKNFSISIIEIIGVLISSALFMSIHINYYGDMTALLAVFVSGLILGFSYILLDDLTQVVFAHFLINIYNVLPDLITILFQVSF